MHVKPHLAMAHWLTFTFVPKVYVCVFKCTSPCVCVGLYFDEAAFWACANIHTYVLAYIYAHIHYLYTRTHVRADMHIHTHIHTYIDTYIHRYIHTYTDL
jgi:hypothetical protein